MLDIKSLSQVPIQVVRFRQNDDLECAVCLEYGPIVIIEIQEQMYDICNSCASAVGIPPVET